MVTAHNVGLSVNLWKDAEHIENTLVKQFIMRFGNVPDQALRGVFKLRLLEWARASYLFEKAIAHALRLRFYDSDFVSTKKKNAMK